MPRSATNEPLISGRSTAKGSKVSRKISLPAETYDRAERYMKFIGDEDFSYLVDQALQFVFRKDKAFRQSMKAGGEVAHGE